MSWLEDRRFWGLLLIGLGLLFMLQTLGIIPVGPGLVWAIIFGLAGLAFLGFFLGHRGHWWAVIPAFTLLGLAGLLAISEISPRWGGAVGGSLFLGAIGLSFWVIYLVHPAQWWAIIPGGVLVTLAVVAGIGQVAGEVAGAILFFGLGLTFGALSFVPTDGGRHRWALIPAAVLLLMGFFVLAATTGALGYLWPIILIAAGLYLLYRNLPARSGG